MGSFVFAFRHGMGPPIAVAKVLFCARFPGQQRVYQDQRVFGAQLGIGFKTPQLQELWICVQSLSMHNPKRHRVE
jgi:hypothetical protein